MGKGNKKPGMNIPQVCVHCAKIDGKSGIQLFGDYPIGSYTNHYGSSIETVKQYAAVWFKVCDTCKKELEELKKKESLIRNILLGLISAVVSVGFFLVLRDEAEIFIMTPIIGLIVFYELYKHFGVNERKFNKKHLGYLKTTIIGEKKEKEVMITPLFVNGEYQKLYDGANAGKE